MKPTLRFHDCRISDLKWNNYSVLYLENSRVRIGILPEKGADIFEFRYKPLDLDVLWHRAKAWPDPVHYRPESLSDSDAFYDHYVGGWQESFPVGNTCGELRGAKLGLHGEVCLLPWEFDVIEDKPERIEIELRVHCRRTPFQLTRRMSLQRDESFVRLDEEIVNLGGETLEYVWGHHPAFGAPFLSEACVLDLPPGSYSTLPAVAGRTPRFEPGQKRHRPVLSGSDGQEIDLRKAPAPDTRRSDNWEAKLSEEIGRVALRNPQLGVGFGMVWDAKIFPHLWEWENASGVQGYPLWSREYLLALEPFNCPVGGLISFAGKNILPRLKADGRERTTFKAGFCDPHKIFKGEFLA